MPYVPQTSRPPDQSGSGSSFTALRAFLDANRQQGEQYAQGLVGQGVQDAQAAQQQAGALNSLSGGGTANGTAVAAAKDARAKALGSLDSTAGQMNTPGEVEGYLQNQQQGLYPAGQSAADAYLVGRSGALREAKDWQGVVNALNPMAAAPSKQVQPQEQAQVAGLAGPKKRREVY